MPRYFLFLILLVHLTACNTTGNIVHSTESDNDYSFSSLPKPITPKDKKVSHNSCMTSSEGRLTRPKLTILNPVNITGVALDPKNKNLLLRTDNNIRVWDLLKGQQRSTQDQAVYPVFSENILWPDGNIRLAINTTKGTLEVFSRASNKLLASIWLTDKTWAVVDNHGRFDADPVYWSNFSWSNGNNNLNFMQLADMYYEPALLAKLSSDAKLDTPNALSISNGISLPPKTTLDVSFNKDNMQISGIVRVKRRGGCIGNVRVFHNGKAIKVEAPKNRNPEANLEQWKFTVAKLSSNGKHVFKALATNSRKVEGTPVVKELQIDTSTNRAPHLHLLTIAVDQYSNPELNLNFAVADAQAIVTWAKNLRSTANTIFEKVIITEVYNQKATRKRVLQELEKLQTLQPQDTIIIYLAGHGENNGVRWFYLPTEFGTELSIKAVSAEGISSKVIQQALIKTPAQRIALIVDACKSGDLRTVFASATDSRYLEWLSRTTGVSLLAATDQKQLAIELPVLGHGAMTFTVLQGLSGNARNISSDGVVSANELLQYTEKTLPEITKRITGISQYPVGFYYGPDFPLTRNQ